MCPITIRRWSTARGPIPTTRPITFRRRPAGWWAARLRRGIAWGAGFAIGHAIWDDFDWRHGNINVDIDKNVNIDRNVNRGDVNFRNGSTTPIIAAA